MAACDVGLLFTPAHCWPPPTSGLQPAGTGAPSAVNCPAPGMPQLASRNVTLICACPPIVFTGFASNILVDPIGPALSANVLHCAMLVCGTCASERRLMV